MPPDEPHIESIVEESLDAVRARAATDGASSATIHAFREAVWEHAARSGRDMPWRQTDDPYRILVSEVMLQQTQVDRVRPKYEVFLEAFPDPAALAEAPFEDVLRLWKGLGYNRRALALQRSMQAIVERHGGRVPSEEAALLELPGIGPATAAGVRCFAFGEPDVYLETNVRAAVLFAFFPGLDGVPDREVRRVVRDTLDPEDPRAWYYALMDLGAALKRAHPNPSRGSAHHVKQAPFEGSDRQVRGRALDVLLDAGPLAGEVLVSRVSESLDTDVERVERIVDALATEGLLARDGAQVRIA